MKKKMNVIVRILGPDGFTYGEPVTLCPAHFDAFTRFWTGRGLTWKKLGITERPCEQHDRPFGSLR